MTTALASPDTRAVAPGRVGREGWLDLGFERRGARSVLARSRWTVPLQVMAPLALDDRAAIVSILNPTGGLVGGDRLAIDVDVADGAHACLTTPSATKVYRTAGGCAEQQVRLRAGRGATLEWVPDHTIPHAGASFRQTIDADVAPGAALVLVDAFAAGRIARGEAWRFTRLDSRIAVRDEEGPILHDRFAVDGGDLWPRLGFAEGHAYVASVVVVADDARDGLAAALDRALARCGNVAAGTARLARRGLLVRCLARDAPAMVDAVDLVWRETRAALGLPALALRKP